jgi:hypothetical protein
LPECGYSLQFGLTINVNEVSYLVGKPFVSLLSYLSEKLCLTVLGVSEVACSFSVVKDSIPFSYAERFARLVLMCDCFPQMSDHRRRGGRRTQQEQQASQDEASQPQLPPPPPMMTIE